MAPPGFVVGIAESPSGPVPVLVPVEKSRELAQLVSLPGSSHSEVDAGSASAGETADDSGAETNEDDWSGSFSLKKLKQRRLKAADRKKQRNAGVNAPLSVGSLVFMRNLRHAMGSRTKKLSTRNPTYWVARIRELLPDGRAQLQWLEEVRLP